MSTKVRSRTAPLRMRWRAEWRGNNSVRIVRTLSTRYQRRAASTVRRSNDRKGSSATCRAGATSSRRTKEGRRTPTFLPAAGSRRRFWATSRRTTSRSSFRS